ncbi:MAG: phenylalanine--tRNA ligase subunit beta [Dehalococcoidales bacterium]|nr:phenylalanine--tRNA ligase subunit beta [Dehalococcoidales bacterium]
MKIPLKWLKEYVDTNLPALELANKLTMAGNEVKGMQIIGSKWDGIVVGQILAVNPHPNADRLRLPTIDLGNEQQTVVCGAPNLRIGAKVAFARVGTELRDGHTGKMERLKTAKIRGVESSGMACSEMELGISDNHEGILILPEDAPIGMPLAGYMGDAIFDFDITPNRPDCLCVTGIAREIKALTGCNFSLPDTSYEETGSPIEQQVKVEINASDLCLRYSASLITGVKIAESPQWLQQRLLACGMRPINNIVDITNFVMMEYGQPLHSFDYDRIRGQKIIVRRADDREVFITLDGEERTLSHDMLVIADAEGTVAVAGVMGGANSEIFDSTTSILLEAASFNPASIHYTGRNLNLPSEACMRFERGIRADLTLPALRRATQLIKELAGGEVSQGIIDLYPGQQDRKPIMLSLDKMTRLLGVKFTSDQVTDALKSLGFECETNKNTNQVLVSVPYWRSDINLAEDLMEEVARVIGYDVIPTTMLSQSIPEHNVLPILNFKQKAGLILTGYGFQEVITFTLTGMDSLKKLMPGVRPLDLMPIRMANPMSAEREYLRPTLRASVLADFAANRRHEDGGIRLFELGKVYLPLKNDLPDEPEIICGVLGGSRFEKTWLGQDEPVDFYDAKGVVQGLFDQFGITVMFTEGKEECLVLGKQAELTVDGKSIGILGEVHPRVLQKFDIEEPVYLFEIKLNDILTLTSGYKIFQPVPRFPAMVRDLALIIDYQVSHQQVLDTMKGFPLVTGVDLFDSYSGDQVPQGKKSLAYRIIFQSPVHTLTDKEVDKVQRQILAKLSKLLGATLRS